ncbi:outer membrane beta-barrel protein [Sphingomonas oleivorans]|nr:outer membrane beta-barrel protein [Sphingomonas oleivorans]
MLLALGLLVIMPARAGAQTVPQAEADTPPEDQNIDPNAPTVETRTLPGLPPSGAASGPAIRPKRRLDEIQERQRDQLSSLVERLEDEEIGEEPFGLIASVAGGYDNNPDEIEDRTGTSVIRADTSLLLRHDGDSVSINGRATGALLDTTKIKEPNRYLYDVQLETSYSPLDGLSVVLDGEREYDALGDPTSIYDQASAGLELETETIGFALHGGFEQLRYKLRNMSDGSEEEEDGEDGEEEDEDEDEDEEDIGGSPTGDRIQEIDDPALLASLNYRRITAEARLDLMTDSAIAPFVNVRAAKVTFPDPLPDVPSRNARDYVVIAGVVLQPVEELELTLGGRWNHRTFRSGAFSSVEKRFVEAGISYQPSDKFELTGSVERAFEEPGYDDARVRDAKNFELELKAAPTTLWYLALDASYSRGREIGAAVSDREFEVGAELTIRLAGSLSLFGRCRHLHYKARSEGETMFEYQRTLGHIGLKAIF